MSEPILDRLRSSDHLDRLRAEVDLAEIAVHFPVTWATLVKQIEEPKEASE